MNRLHFSRAQWLRIGILLTVIVASLIQRAHGFTSTDLFFDDAWAAMPARVSMNTAWHMTVSTPLWTMLLRQWIIWAPHATWWAQMTAYLGGAVLSLVIYPFFRYFRVSAWTATVLSALLIVNPIITIESTRVKPYTWEAVWGIAVLVLAEALRRAPSHRRWLAFTLVSTFAAVMSFAMVFVVAGAWLSTGLWAIRQRENRRSWILGGVVATLTTGLVAWSTLKGQSPSLGDNWKRRGYLADWSSVHAWLHNSVLMARGIFRSLFSFGVIQHFVNSLTTRPENIFAALILLMVLAVAWRWRRLETEFRRSLRAVLLSLAAVLLASQCDLFPFGDGRTDVVFYPSMLLLLGVAIDSALPTLRSRGPLSRYLAAGVFAVVGSAGIGATLYSTPALYPTLDLRGLWSQLRNQIQPTDIVVVPTYLSFSWAYAGITSSQVVLHPPGWPQGFRLESTDTRVMLPEGYKYADAALATLHPSYLRVWYVGYELGVWDPYAASSALPSYVPALNRTYGGLVGNHWQEWGLQMQANNCFVWPMVWTLTPLTI